MQVKITNSNYSSSTDDVVRNSNRKRPLPTQFLVVIDRFVLFAMKLAIQSNLDPMSILDLNLDPDGPLDS